jgi:hypothetical protein
MRTKVGGTRLEKPKVLLVEGKDEEIFFKELLTYINIIDDFTILSAKGKDKFGNYLKTLINELENYENVTSIGIIRDADNNPKGAFDSICSALQSANLPYPSKTTECIDGTPKTPKICVMILPGEGRCGMLEDLCLQSVKDSQVMNCVENYFECIKESVSENDFPNNVSKANVCAFLSGMEWFEAGYFESIQKNSIEFHTPNDQTIPEFHAFLSSKYKPVYDLGLAAEKKYWPFDNEAFKPLIEFLNKI